MPRYRLADPDSRSEREAAAWFRMVSDASFPDGTDDLAKLPGVGEITDPNVRAAAQRQVARYLASNSKAIVKRNLTTAHALAGNDPDRQWQLRRIALQVLSLVEQWQGTDTLEGALRKHEQEVGAAR